MGQVTIGADTYDIYGTEAAAKSYMKARLGADSWDDASSLNRKKALISATRWLDRANWQGQKTSDSQALQFPRTGLTDCDGNDVPSDAVPTLVEQACYEGALILLGDATAMDQADAGNNIKRLKAGSAEMEYFRGGYGSSGSAAAPPFPTAMFELVRCFLEGASGITAPYASGYCEESQFDDDDRCDRSKGLA